MPTFRSNRSDDLVLKDGNTGINSSSPTAKLDVVGYVKGINANVTGVATFSSYSGYLKSNQNIVDNRVIKDSSSTLSGEIIVGAGKTLTVSESSEVGQGNILSLKVSNTFNPPIGGINDRPSAPQPGALYYNKDFRTIEYWDGNFWRQVEYTTTSGRGFVAGGGNPVWAGGEMIFYINIPTQGTSTYFGDLSQGRGEGTSVSNSIRGICCGGYRHGQSPNYSNVIDYVTMASSGKATDFGDAIAEKASQDSGCSSSTRGLFMGGNYHPGTNDEQIEYINIMTTGNAADFGDLVDDNFGGGGVSNGIRGIVAGGNGPTFAAASPAGSLIQYVNIASLGNAVNFGNLTYARQAMATGCSSTRGIFAGGYNPTNGNGKKIDYITMASDGNAVLFGDLVAQSAGSYMAGTSTQTRMIFAGNISPAGATHIQYVEIASTGEAMDFGECRNGTNNFSVMMYSDSHGGLGGF